MITVYGVSKPKEGNVHVMNPLYDTRICLCPDKSEVTFAESICKAMARRFPGELYYCWDPDTDKATYSFLVSEEENQDTRYSEMLQHNAKQYLKQDALVACLCRGHRMFPIWNEMKSGADCHCRDCGMSVFVVYYPKPNEIHISGEAVALDCKDSRLE